MGLDMLFVNSNGCMAVSQGTINVAIPVTKADLCQALESNIKAKTPHGSPVSLHESGGAVREQDRVIVSDQR